MTNSEWQQIEDVAIGFAKQAGEITLDYFKRGFSVNRKVDGSFVTVADLEAERYLRAAIAKVFPDDGIIGEEEGEKAGTSGRKWILDPIDGTFSFVHQVPFFGVLIALEVENDPVLGVINIPALSELVSASKGNGCKFNGDTTHVSATCALDEALLLATDFGACDNYGFGEAIGRLERKVSARRTWGDCYGYVLVATGRADIMVDPVMNLWDCAALLPVMEESGGTFTDWNGMRTIRGGNSIATNGALFNEVMSTIKLEG
jgi:histidinol-phosphatase